MTVEPVRWRVRALGALATAALAASGFAAGANAQAVVSETSDVIVDLSVLDDSGYGRGPAPAPLPSPAFGPGAAASLAPSATPGRQLLMPGPQFPVSQFYGPSGPGVAPRETLVAPPPRPEATPKAPPRAAAKPKPPAVAKKEKKEPPATAEPRAPRTAPTKPVTTEAPSPPATPPAPPPVALAAPQPASPPPASPSAPPPPPTASKPPPAPPPSATPTVTQPVPPRTEPSPKTASLPPGPAPTGERALQIAFAAGDSKLPAPARDGLKTLADRLKTEEGLRLQLLAYAGGGDLSASAARRLSLSRALAVRSFLIENGVRSTRIDVRALGDKTTEQPVNRVDIHVAER
jgi:outer membrane protein OmpA-like peptidoglycan-associated protein